MLLIVPWEGGVYVWGGVREKERETLTRILENMLMMRVMNAEGQQQGPGPEKNSLTHHKWDYP